MTLRFMLICLIVTRAMLGWTCGSARESGGEPGSGGGCCQTTCSGGQETCDSGPDSVACMLCAACDGRVPVLPPATDPTSLNHQDWTAILARPSRVEPAITVAEAILKTISAAQVQHGVAWIERLRAIVCVWTI